MSLVSMVKFVTFVQLGLLSFAKLLIFCTPYFDTSFGTSIATHLGVGGRSSRFWLEYNWLSSLNLRMWDAQDDR